MPGVAELASAINASSSEARGDVILTGLNPRNDELEEDFVFQYYPESLTDTKQINHQQKEIPGGSLPLMQWISSGERVISFTAVFSCDVDLLALGENRSEEIHQRIRSEGLERRNVDIRTAASLLRSFMLPTYGQDAGLGVPVTFAPRKIRLFIPGSGIGVTGGVYVASEVTPDSIFCVMTQCDVTYQAMFPSGLPRLVEISLSFSQVAQIRGTVNFPQSIYGSEDVNVTALNRLQFRGAARGFLPYTLKPRKKAGVR